MYFMFVLLYRNIFLSSFGKKKESGEFNVFSTLRHRLTFFGDPCSVCCLLLSLVPLRFTTDLKNSLSLHLRPTASLFIFLPQLPP